ncbi:MAG TPA: hypothetical protein VIJ65_04375 [Acidobacteriaceae bacterium]
MSNLKYIAAPRLVPPSLIAIALAAAACAMLVSPDVRPFVQHLAPFLHGRDPRIAGGVAGGIAVVGVAAWIIARLRRPSAEEMERRRRDQLATTGRITDGVLIDARTLGGEESTSPTPEVLFYSYRLAGVTYDCAQDVSTLPERVLGWKLDQPLQVRYDPRNPGNSVVVAESWSGLWQGHA